MANRENGNENHAAACEHCQDSGRALYQCGMIHQCICRIQNVQCAECHAEVTILQPSTITNNGLLASTIVMVHEEGVVCPNCQAVYRFEFTSKPEIGLALVKKPQSLIASPHDIGIRPKMH